jgi:hypothetical protein
MGKWKRGELKSGGNGATVTNQRQAVAIMESEKRKAEGGKTEYQSQGIKKKWAAATGARGK